MFQIGRERGTERAFFLLLVCGILAAALLSGCGGQEQPSGQQGGAGTPTAPKRTPAPTPTPSPGAGAAGLSLANVEACGDVFELFALKDKYAQQAAKSQALDEALTKKQEVLTAKMVPRNLLEGLDFLAVETKCTGEKEYTFSFLLKATADLDTNYHLTVLGFVFPSNARYLPEDRREAQYVQWTHLMRNDHTSQWKQGEIHAVRFTANAESIPYNLQFLLHTRDEQGRWTENVGERLSLGWQWAVPDEEAFIGKVAACNDFAALYALAPPGPRMSARVARAVSGKWEALTAGMTPKTMIEGLDCLGVNTKATGRKEYTFSFLLRSTADLNTDYHLSVIGAVDQRHRQYIKPEKPDGSYTSWALLLYNDPTSQWKAGEYHVAQLKVETEIIPFNMSVILQTRGAQRQWTGNPGNVIDLGWQADVPK